MAQTRHYKDRGFVFLFVENVVNMRERKGALGFGGET